LKVTCILLTGSDSIFLTSRLFGCQLKCRLELHTPCFLRSSSRSYSFTSTISPLVTVDDLMIHFQEVVDKSKQYTKWDFHYTNVTRQVGNMTMATYEASLGRQTSTNYPLVNFLMATEADFFVGALGSTWCYLIDGMRNTGGKVMAGYLSVNKDRFW